MAWPENPGFGTRAVHGGGGPRPGDGGLSVGPAVSTTYARVDASTPGPWVYSRHRNPSVERFEAQIGALEGGQAVAFGSGIAAIVTTLEVLGGGGHLVATASCYHNTRDALREVLPGSGTTVTFVDTSDAAAVRAAFRPETRVIYVETPSNPLLLVSPLRPLVALAASRGAVVVVDATFAGPLLLQPLRLGAEVVVHSATKVLAGHSDVTAGVAVCRGPDLAARLHRRRTLDGSILSPWDAFLAERGVKTVHLRVPVMVGNAGAVARFLAGHREVIAVHYPGLSGPLPGDEMATGGYVCSFELADAVRAQRVAGALRLFTLATSVGGVESLAEWRHAADPEAPEGLIRLSLGVEDEADLVADLACALDA